MKANKLFLFTLLLFTLLLLTNANEILPQQSLFTGQQASDTSITFKSAINDFGLSASKTPAEWMQKAGYLINDLFTKSVTASSTFDTTRWDNELESLDRHSQRVFRVMVSAKDKKISLLELYDLEAQVNGVMTKLDRIAGEIKKYSDNYSDYYYLTTLVSEENFLKITKSDSNMINVYRPEFEEKLKTAGNVGGNFLKYLKVLSRREKTKNGILNGSLALREMLAINIRTFQSKILTQDEPPLWGVFGREYTAYGSVLYNSFTFAYNSVSTYIEDSSGKNAAGKIISLLVPLGLLFYYYRLRKTNYAAVENLNYLKSFPLLISGIVFLTLFKYALEYPPSAVSKLLTLAIMSLVSAVVIKRHLDKEFRIHYCIFFAYYALVTANNLFSEPSIAERILFFLSVIPAYITISYLRRERRMKRETGRLLTLLLYFLLLNLLAGFAFNLTGMTAMSRVVITGGMNSFMTAVFLIIAVKTILDYVYLGTGFYNSMNTAIRLDIEDIKIQIVRLFGLFAVIIWVVTYLTDVHSYNYAYNLLSDFLLEERKIGNIEYTAGTVVIFIFVVSISFYVSGLIRNIIEVNDFAPGRTGRSSAGGFLLILRLFVISFGFLIALAASGLPLDKLTILISALSVGIGFGLQNIINNLVSGVIIAMEKPFRIGDFVNFAGLNGNVKEIGIRSSVITTEDGSELIIPNGDLISKNLINWTSNNRFKKDNIIVEIRSSVPEVEFREILSEALSPETVSNEISGLNMYIVSISRGVQKWTLNFWINDLSRMSETKGKMVNLIHGSLTAKEITVIACG